MARKRLEVSEGWRCSFCDTSNELNDQRCLVCDTLRPAVAPPAASSSSSGPQDRPSRTSPAGARGRTNWTILTAGAVVMIAAVAVVIVVRDGRGGTAPSGTAAVDAAAGVAPATTITTTTTAASSTTTSTSGTTTSVVAPTVTPAPSLTVVTVTTSPRSVLPTPAASGAADPVEGSWTAIFISCNDQATCARTASSVRPQAPGATLIAPGTYRSLRSYWVVAAGSFATGEAAAAYCRSIGRTSRDDCFGRYLSQDPADLSKIVYPD